ncbi:MAG TPA: XRE family transcriptional regulator [Geobacteraceae bacterium]|nr:XRE family transcriptional regulator [Geobacteraceae bacterium]
MGEYDIGTKLKKIRQGKKLTLKEVAEKAGCSIALLSQIENNNISPPIATLSRLAKVLDFKLSTLFEHEDDEVRFEVVRKGHKQSFSRFIPLRNKKFPHFHEPYFRKIANKKMTPYLINLSDDISDTLSYSHEGESFIYVMNGRFELFLDSQWIDLEEGDCVYFDTSLSHRYRCKKGSQATILELRAAS